MFDSQRDAAMRLDRSVVRRDGKPIYITEVYTASKFAYYAIGKAGVLTDNVIEGRVDDPLFDFSSIPLGYIQHNRSAHYVQRIPTRKYKQGIWKQNVHVKNRRVDSTELLLSAGFYAASQGKYKSFEEALDALKAGLAVSIAFGRAWAVDEDMRLRYKGKTVGKVDGDGEPVLSDNYIYLTEALKEVYNV